MPITLPIHPLSPCPPTHSLRTTPLETNLHRMAKVAIDRGRGSDGATPLMLACDEVGNRATIP